MVSITDRLPGTRRAQREQATRVRKPGEMLASVVPETNDQSVVEILGTNDRFIFPSRTSWVVLLLAADDIGGLSQKHNRDEAKGSIIQLIGSDQIKIVANEQMLARETFGIIPEPGTLERMDEYTLLREAPYAWGVVYWSAETGRLRVDPIGQTSLAQAQAVQAGTLPLRNALGEQAWFTHSGELADARRVEAATQQRPAYESTSADEATTGEPPFVQDQPIFDDQSGFDQPNFGGEGDNPVFDEQGIGEDLDAAAAAAQFEALEADPVADPQVAQEQDIQGDHGQSAVQAEAIEPEDTAVEYDEQDEYDEDPDLDDEDYDEATESLHEPAETVVAGDQTEAREAIARRFLSEELDLQVDLTEFNTSFRIDAPIVQIDVPKDSTEWLGDQVAQLTRQANADLTRERQANEDSLRSMYVAMMSTHAETVMRQVAVDREGSRYKALKDGVDRANAERVAEKEQRIRARRSEIQADFAEQIKSVGEQAARQAEAQYRERNRSRIERAELDAVAEIERSIENAHTADLAEILRVRRSDSKVKMEVGTSRIFEVLIDKQKENLQAERDLLASWTERIQHVIDEHRKDDIAQYQTLAEQQRLTDQVAALRTEHEQHLESIRNEHADRLREKEEELERVRQEASGSLQKRDLEWQGDLNIQREKTASALEQVTTLIGQNEQIEAQTAGRYEGRIAELQNDLQRYQTQMEQAGQVQSRANKIMISLMVAMPILGGLAGFIVGQGI